MSKPRSTSSRKGSSKTLSALKFVQGAIASKDFVPALRHFQIADRRITAFDGIIGLSSPIDVDLDCKPSGAHLIKAISVCNETIAMHMSDGNLVVRSGKFSTSIGCMTSDFPVISPHGIHHECPANFIAKLSQLEPYVCDDASRPWSNGVRVSGDMLYATNNAVILQSWVDGGRFGSPFTIPRKAVNELVRIGDCPKSVLLTQNQAFFSYEDGRWMATQLLSTRRSDDSRDEWPDIAGLLSMLGDCEMTFATEEFWSALETLKPFAGESRAVYMNGDHISTVPKFEYGGAVGTAVELLAPSTGIFNVDYIFNLKGIALKFGFANYPKAVKFTGNGIRGAIMGLRA